MNEKLQEFLDKKRKEESNKARKEKISTLVALGLYDKVYSQDNIYCEEYNFFEWDEEENRNKYYKIVPIEITDEEYEEVKKYRRKEVIREENTIATILTVIAWIVFIGGFFAGVVLGPTEVYKEVYGEYKVETEFSFAVAFVYWAIAFISGTMFLGFAEIIKLLNDIKNK